MAKIIFLGTAASIPSLKRDNTALLFSYNRKYMLIDCPGSIVKKVLMAGVDYKKIKRIILTHHHPDHIYGMVHLIHTLAKTSLKRISVYTNKVTMGVVRRMIRSLRVDRLIYPQLDFYNVWLDEYFYQDASVKIKAIRNRHTTQSFGIKVIMGKHTWLYSSDSALCPEILTEAQGCEYIIHDCTGSRRMFKKNKLLYTMHTDAASLAEAFSSVAVKKIVPVHLLLTNNHKESRITQDLRPLGKRCFIPQDFESISI